MVSSAEQIHRPQPRSVPRKRISWIVIRSAGHQCVGRTYTDQSGTSYVHDRSTKSCNRAIAWRSYAHACSLWVAFVRVTHSSGVLSDVVFHLAQTKVSWLRQLGRPCRAPAKSMSQCPKSQTVSWHLPYRGWKWKQIHTWHVNGPGCCCALIALRASWKLLMPTQGWLSTGSAS